MQEQLKREPYKVNFSAVLELTLADNELTTPVGIDVFSHLKRLDLSFNNITIVRGLPSTITHLNLSHNHLEHIFGLDHLQVLYELDVGDNQLRDMTGLYHNTNLRVLRVSNNLIPSIESIESLKNLER
jgi:Leucine-rich repeat (LRR) protein